MRIRDHPQTVTPAPRTTPLRHQRGHKTPAHHHDQLTLSGIGIRLSNVQYYFPTRDTLVAALLDHYLTETLMRLSEPLASQSLHQVVRRVLDEQCDRASSVLFTELWSLAGHSREVEGAVRAFYLKYESLVVDQLRIVRPDLSPTDLHSRARVFVLLLEGASLFRAGVAGDRDNASDGLLYETAVGLLS